MSPGRELVAASSGPLMLCAAVAAIWLAIKALDAIRIGVAYMALRRSEQRRRHRHSQMREALTELERAHHDRGGGGGQ